MSYTKVKKLKKDEGRHYEVRLNLGDAFFPPSNNMKHWRLGVDERGGYWIRNYKAKKREEVVYRMMLWYRTSRYKAKNYTSSVFHKLPHSVDAALEVTDHYEEVVFYPNMRSMLPKNRLLTPDKVKEIVDLSKGKFVKNTEYTNQGSFVCSPEYLKAMKNLNHQGRYLLKVPDVRYLYKHKQTESYYAAIQIGKGKSILSDKMIDRSYSIMTSEGKKKVSYKARKAIKRINRRSFLKLKSTELKAAIREANHLAKTWKTADGESVKLLKQSFNKE